MAVESGGAARCDKLQAVRLSLIRVRGLCSGVLIGALSIPGDCQGQQRSQPPKAEQVKLALPVRPSEPQAAQTQNPPAQQGMGGIAGGVQAAPVYDLEKRPITAGGFVDTGTVVFQDITKQAGLSGWAHKMGVPEKKFIVEANGSGVCLVDYDND